MFNLQQELRKMYANAKTILPNMLQDDFVCNYSDVMSTEFD